MGVTISTLNLYIDVIVLQKDVLIKIKKVSENKLETGVTN